MLTVIILLAIFIVSGVLCFIYRDDIPTPSIFCCVCSAIFLFVCGVINYIQYEDAIYKEAFYVLTIKQYRNSIEMYKDEAVLTLNEESFTDFKYQGYQENIMEEIRALKEEIISYNKSLYARPILKKNPFLSWIIVPLSDKCKPLTLREN